MKKIAILFLFSWLLAQSAPAQERPAAAVATLYHSEHCGACLRFRREVLPELKERYAGRVQWVELCTDQSPENTAKLWSAVRRYRGGSAKAYIPAVEVGGALLMGGELKDGLEPALEEALLGGPAGLDLQADPLALKKEFSSLSVTAVISSGLIDGINPCAFAVIVFFISFLAVYGYSRREILVVGSAYCCGVFAAYVVIGLGIFHALYALSGFYWAMKLFYYLMAAVCFVFAGLSLRDYYIYRTTGKAEGFVLQLPQGLKVKINKVMGLLRGRQQELSLPRLFAAAFLVGILVSAIEAVCTGQVYVPTIAFIMKDPQLRLKAFSYLLLYNLMFVLPLAAVFAVSLAGCSSERISGYFKRTLGVAKLLLAALFAGLGSMLLFMS